MVESMTVLLAIVLILLMPSNAHAWGAGIHIQLGNAMLANAQFLSPQLAGLLSTYPFDFYYGCMAADIVVGKKFTHYLLHCHRWQIGFKVLEGARTDAQRACAYGYLSHLAADSIAHNYYVPIKIMRGFNTMTLKHAYWEMRFERFVDREMWEIARKVCQEHYQENDELLRSVLANTLFSFGTNKRIFNSIVLLSRLEKWQGVLRTLSDTSRFVLEEDDRSEYMILAEEAIIDLLNHGEDAQICRADPTGERALALAEAVRRNMRLLYTSGKISKESALQRVNELREPLRQAIWEPTSLANLHNI
ncbi:MAG TPA: zinc dependent phospholipase C family protein [Geobacterales bacterium]|nr:zinc dependent phospholipase C family protein [Geobacterales bacterium]